MKYITDNETATQEIVDRWTREGGTSLQEILDSMKVEEEEEHESAVA